jgi:hypothetical protein
MIFCILAVFSKVFQLPSKLEIYPNLHISGVKLDCISREIKARSVKFFAAHCFGNLRPKSFVLSLQKAIQYNLWTLINQERGTMAIDVTNRGDSERRMSLSKSKSRKYFDNQVDDDDFSK